MNVTSHRVRFAAVFLLLTLAACGGGGDDGGAGGGTLPAGTVIGAAGGTVVGPNGAKVVIPAGALATDTTINIEQIASSATALPAGFTAQGQMFAFTPHGTTFAVPVTITLPYNLASKPAGTTPTLYKTNSQNQWEHVATATFKADSLSARVTSFSDFTAVIPPLTLSNLVRVWSFLELRGDALEEVEVAGDTQVGGHLHEIFDHGPAFFDSDYFFDDGSTLEADGIANSEIASFADGVTYWVGAEAPLGNATLPNDPIGSKARLVQYQTFTKNAADATYKFTLTQAFIAVSDGNSVLSRRCPTGRDLLGAACDLIKGELYLDVQAFTDDPDTQKITFFRTAGGASLNGGASANSSIGPRISWLSSAWNETFSRAPLWTTEDFDFVADDFNGAEGQLQMTLRSPRTYTVDISSVGVGKTFTVKVVTHASTYNRAAVSVSGTGTEFETAVNAYLRDPLSIGGTTVTTTGLTPVNTPLPLVDPVDAVVPPAACVPGPGPDPAAGVLQFSAAGYTLAEANNSAPTITVTRSGGSRGSVTATFATSNATAIAGADYTAVNATVFFADGDAVPRIVNVPIIPNLVVAPDRTVNLTLSQPGGCAALGTQITAVLTIRNDDVPPPPPSISIGGTVTGLTGTGLVLQHVSTGENLATGNGPFTFSQLLPSGFGYSVAVGTQPSNPSQVCTVTNGSGVANANVTNVAVSCITPTANGALDPSFGGAGKVSTAFGGDETAMALQADGKIVMVGGSGSDFVLARYNADGSLDTGFGSGGLVTTDFLGNVIGNEAHGVAIQSDGKIVVVGFAVVGRTPRNLSNFDFALARYHIDGTLDLGFGTGGKVTTDFNGVADRGFAVAIQTDGKIVVVGDAGFDTPNGVGADFGLARYNADGTLDTTFGNGGKLTTDIAGGIDIAHNVIVSQGNGAILVSGAGTTAGDAGLDQTGLARYDTHGVLDGSFGTGGKITLTGKRVNEGLVLQGDGKILLAGSVSVGIFPARSSQFALMRLTANGSPDNGFGTAGLVTTPFSTQDDFGRAVAVQADGRIVVAGQSSNRSNPDFAVARFSDNGTLDSSFGTGGKLTIDFFGSFDGAENVLMQPDGKIVLGGFARNGTRTGYGLARVLP